MLCGEGTTRCSSLAEDSGLESFEFGDSYKCTVELTTLQARSRALNLRQCRSEEDISNTPVHLFSPVLICAFVV